MDEATREAIRAINNRTKTLAVSEQVVWLASALLQLDQQMTEIQAKAVHPEYVKFTRTLVNQLHNHRHLLEMKEGEPVWTTAEIMRAETPPSLPVIEPQEESQPGSPTSSRTWHLVKAGRHGALEIMATVTFPASNSPPTLGVVRKFLRDNDCNLVTPTWWASLRQSGLTPPSPQSNGPSAGIAAVGERGYLDYPPYTAVGPEGRFAEEGQGNG